LSHKGKTISDITYNVADQLVAYTNPTIQPRIIQYNTTAREVHGPEFDLRMVPLDGEVIMIRNDKQHGRYFVCNSILDPAEVPSLSVVKARSTSLAPPIQRRLTVVESFLETVMVIRCLYLSFNDPC
jgi:hypothetical protein